jgi:hypothetical protein
MKLPAVGQVPLRRQFKEQALLSSQYASHCDAPTCEHGLLPVLSRDSASDQILGWECIFCNEHFENYPAACEVEVALAPSSV